MNLHRRSVVFDNPLYHFDAYGIRNPMVMEVMRLGGYEPGPCFGCRGRGWNIQMRYSMEQGKWIEEQQTCRTCGGRAKVDPSRSMSDVYESDFGDEADMEVALRLIPGLRIQKSSPVGTTRRLR